MAAKKVLKEVKFWTPLRVVSTLIVLGLLAAFGVSSCNSNDPAETTSAPRVAVNPRPPNRPNTGLVSLPQSVLDTENRAASGAPIKLSNYSGKVLLVNLWATWCGPCRMETPELVKLHKEFGSQGLEVVGLSTENPNTSAEAVREFIQDFNVNYRVGWSGPEVALALMQGRDAIPQSR